MSHQSGIKPSASLHSAFTHAHSNPVRAIQVVLVDGKSVQESLECSKTVDVQSSWSQDFNLIQDWFQPNIPCFLLYKLDASTAPCNVDDTTVQDTKGWLLGLYIPDTAPVRMKMLYASCKATLSKELGDSKFVDYLYGSTPEEFSLQGYMKHRQHTLATSPLTQREQELINVKMNEGIQSSRTHLAIQSQGMLQFPVEQDALDAIDSVVKGQQTVCVLSIDMAAESIHLEFVDAISSLDVLASHSQLHQGLTHPRYIFYKWNSKFIFASTCPETSTIKERTLYSSTRACLVGVIEERLGQDVKLAKKFELDTITELNDALLEYEFPSATSIPTTNSSTKLFNRPTKPGRRK